MVRSVPLLFVSLQIWIQTFLGGIFGGAIYPKDILYSDITYRDTKKKTGMQISNDTWNGLEVLCGSRTNLCHCKWTLCLKSAVSFSSLPNFQFLITCSIQKLCLHGF